MADGTNPFILLARITVKPGQLDAYLDLAATVDAAVEASEPGMLFHNLDQDSVDPHKLVWTEVYRRSDDFLFHADNPPVLAYVEQHAQSALDFAIEIYGNITQEVVDVFQEMDVPLKHFERTRVGYIRHQYFR